MPVPSVLITNEIRGCSALVGPSWLTLTEGIGIAVMQWLHANPANVTMTGAVPVGAAGAGMVQGKLLCPPNPGIVIGACKGALLTGVQIEEIATAVSIGVAAAISKGGLYMGAVAGVSAGADVSKCSNANAGTLIAAIQAALVATGAGVISPQLATGLGNGISGMIISGLTGTGIVAPVTPAPAVAAGTSPTSLVV